MKKIEINDAATRLNSPLYTQSNKADVENSQFKQNMASDSSVLPRSQASTKYQASLKKGRTKRTEHSISSIRTRSSFSTLQVFIGYLISIVNTLVYGFFMLQTNIHMDFFTQFSRLFLSIIGLCFLVSCSLGFYTMVTFRTYTETDKIIIIMTVFGSIGWAMVLWALWTLLDNLILGFLLTLWTFLSVGMFIGLIWPRGLGWSGEYLKKE